MKRVFILLGMASALPSTAWAQLPTTPPKTPPAAAPAPAASAPVGATPTGPAAPEPATAPAPPAPAPTAPAKAPPGEEYYVDSAPPTTAPAEPPPFEPPPPPAIVFEEPPPPPLVHHLAPNTALWLGARLGWFFPFGNVWAKAQPVSSQASNGYVLQGVPWQDYASSGPMFELDAGVRLGRSYTLFGLWERAQLGSGDYEGGPDGKQNGAESDFWAVGLRASSNPDDLSFVTELAVGYRRARTFFKNDAEYQFTDAPFEARLGLGAELRTSRATSFSALATVGVGGFGSAERVGPNGYANSLTRSYDEGDGHGWLTLTVGAHFDLVRSRY